MIDDLPVSLLISSRNRPQLLLDAVRSVLEGSRAPNEVIVVDQSDVPNEELGALQMPEYVTLRYIKSDTVGLSHSRNIAFEHATHSVIVVIDDDCVVETGWFEAIVQALVAAGPKAIITGRVIAGEAEEQGAFAPSLHASEKPARFSGRITSDPLATFNFALHTATHAEIGPFDVRIGPGTRFPAAEDNDYGYRLLRAGYTIVFEPGAVVRHRSWRTEADYVALRYAYGRGQGAYYGKYLAQGDWYMLWKLFHAFRRRGKTMLGGGRFAVRGELAWICGWAAGMTDWLLHAGTQPSPRREDQRE